MCMEIIWSKYWPLPIYGYCQFFSRKRIIHRDVVNGGIHICDLNSLRITVVATEEKK